MLWLPPPPPTPAPVLVQERLVETRRMLPALGLIAYEAEAGDLDGDGVLDVAVLGKQPHLSLLHGRGDGSFAYEAPELPGGTKMALGDLDGDGDLDLSLGHTVLHQEGGALVVKQELYFSTGTTSEVEFGDVDGDGDLDALLVP